jgi:hypothetical protein
METNIDFSISKYTCRYVPPYCDYSLIKKWLGQCFSEHPLAVHFKCNEGRFGKVTLAELGLIDVAHDCVRLMKLPQKYATLSYHWGRATMPKPLLAQAGSRNGLVRNIPKGSYTVTRQTVQTTGIILYTSLFPR